MDILFASVAAEVSVEDDVLEVSADVSELLFGILSHATSTTSRASANATRIGTSLFFIVGSSSKLSFGFAYLV
jgi:hypothetical protein